MADYDDAREELVLLARGMGDLLEDARIRSEERRELYTDSMDVAQEEWAKANRKVNEYRAAVVGGFAPEWMVREYLLERYRMRRMQRLFSDRAESFAIAELPGASPASTTVAINKSRTAIE